MGEMIKYLAECNCSSICSTLCFAVPTMAVCDANSAAASVALCCACSDAI